MDIEQPQEQSPTEFTLHELESVTCHLGGNNLGKGKLKLTSAKVYWTLENSDNLHTWDYQHIVMHAISTNLDDDEVYELRFSPPAEGQLEELFSAFNKGAEMNPDSGASDEEDESSGFYCNPEEILGGRLPGAEDDISHGSGHRLGMMSTEDFMAMLTSGGQPIEHYDPDAEGNTHEDADETNFEDDENDEKV